MEGSRNRTANVPFPHQRARDSKAKQEQPNEGQRAGKRVVRLTLHAHTYVEKIQTGPALCCQATAVRLYPSMKRITEKLSKSIGTAAAKDSNTPTLAQRATRSQCLPPHPRTLPSSTEQPRWPLRRRTKGRRPGRPWCTAPTLSSSLQHSPG